MPVSEPGPAGAPHGPTVFVPYHQDERIPERSIRLPAGGEVITVTEDLPEGDVWQRLAALYGSVAGAVARQVMSGSVPMVVSGDCLVSLGVLAGAQRAGVEASIVWFDAHGDVHTLETSTSGYLGGIALRLVLGEQPELIARRLGLRPLSERQVVLVDARDLDPAEVDYLASAEVRRCGVAELTVGMLPAGPMVLHIDVDVIDSDELPGLRFPAPSGPSTAAVLAAVRRVVDSGRVVAVDVACPWNPGQGPDAEIRTRLLADLAAAL